VGPVWAFGFFFKDPVASVEHRLAAQFDALCAWAERSQTAAAGDRGDGSAGAGP
jgi:hypothetical protein